MITKSRADGKKQAFLGSYNYFFKYKLDLVDRYIQGKGSLKRKTNL
jgi:hypothetical protein